VIDGASIVGEVIAFPLHEDVTSSTSKRRKNQRRFKGHRQPYTSVRIRQIVVPV